MLPCLITTSSVHQHCKRYRNNAANKTDWKREALSYNDYFSGYADLPFSNIYQEANPKIKQCITKGFYSNIL